MTRAPEPAKVIIPHENGKGIALLAAQILPVMAIVSLFPAIPKLFQQFGNIPHAALLVPMILTIPSLLVAISAPFAGIVADRFGRRSSFLAGLTLYVVAGLVPVFVSNITVIVVSRAFLGIAEAIAVTVSSTLIGDYFGERRQKWTSWVGIVISPAGTAMLIAGGFLAQWNWRGPFFIYLLAIPVLILAILYIDEPHQTAHQRRTGLTFPWRQATEIGALTLVASLIYYVEPLNIAQVFALVGLSSPAAAGLAQGFTTIGYIVGALAYRRTAGRSMYYHMAASWLLTGAGLVLIGGASHLSAALIGAIVQQFGAGFTIPALLAWGQARLPFEQRARGMGIWATAFFVGTFLCPPVVTGIGTVAGGLKPALMLLGFASVGAAAVALLMARSRPALEERLRDV